MSEIEQPRRGLVRYGAALPMPDGPVSLWFVVFSADGRIMGAARASLAPEWQWRGGRLCIGYGHVRVVMAEPGWYDSAVIVAVPQAAEVAALGVPAEATPYAPMWRIGLGEPRELRAGDDMHILDGVLAIEPMAGPDAGEPLR